MIQSHRYLFGFMVKMRGTSITCSGVFISVVFGMLVCRALWLFVDWTPTTAASSRPLWCFTETQTDIFPLPHFNCTPPSVLSHQLFFPLAWIYQNLWCVCVCPGCVHLVICVCVSPSLCVAIGVWLPQRYEPPGLILPLWACSECQDFWNISMTASHPHYCRRPPYDGILSQTNQIKRIVIGGGFQRSFWSENRWNTVNLWKLFFGGIWQIVGCSRMVYRNLAECLFFPRE